MRKSFPAFVAVTTIAASLASVALTAKAGDGQIAAGVAGGLIGGALLGGAIAAGRPAPVYAAPAPVYVEEAPRRLVRQRFWDGYGWGLRPLEGCRLSGPPAEEFTTPVLLKPPRRFGRV